MGGRRLLGSLGVGARTDRGRPERERLETAIKTLEAELPAARAAAPAWHRSTRDLLTQADGYLQRGRLDAGWTSFKAARRQSFAQLGDDQRKQEAQRILAEATAKLDGWRRAAVVEQLRDKKDPSVEDIQAAQQILDEHFGNVFRRLRLLGRHLALLSVLLGVSLVALLALTLGELTGDDAPPILQDGPMLGTVMALRFLGANVSSASGLLTKRDGTERVPTLRGEFALMALRPLVGAASAPFVVIVLQAGFGETVEVSNVGVYALALVAGFSDRLAARAVERAVNAIER